MLFRSDRKSTRLNSSHTLISYALPIRSEEHTSELQSHSHLVCRLLLEKKKRRGSEEHTSELQSQSHLVCRLLLGKKARRAIGHVSSAPPPLRCPSSASTVRPSGRPCSLAFFLKGGPPPQSLPPPFAAVCPI